MYKNRIHKHTNQTATYRNYKGTIWNLSNANYQTNQIINAMECNRVVALYENLDLHSKPRETHTHTQNTTSWSIMFVAFSDIPSTAKDFLFVFCIFCIVSMLSFALSLFRTKWKWLLTGKSVTGNVHRIAGIRRKTEPWTCSQRISETGLSYLTCCKNITDRIITILCFPAGVYAV